MSVDPERARADTTAALERAAAARARGDEGARHAFLVEAVGLATATGDPALLHGALWRLAKALHDAGDAAGALGAIAQLLEHAESRSPGLVSVRSASGPFDHYAAALRAWPLLARAAGDRSGYLNPALGVLWEAWIARQRALGAPFLAAWGEVAAAWISAATGNVEATRALANRLSRARPALYEGDEHVHPRAQNPHDRGGWLTLDAARTWLHAATWADDAAQAQDARDLVLDTAEDLGERGRLDLWTLDAVLRAEERFGLRGDARDPVRHATLAHEPGVPAAHTARARALIARRRGLMSEAAQESREAIRLAALDGAGPEWIVESWRELHLLGGPYAEGAEDAARLAMERTGVRMAWPSPPRA